MEEAVTQRPTSQELQFNQQETPHNGSLGPTDTKYWEDPPHNWHDRSQISVCRDFNRGHCSRGRFCKYRHVLLGEQERSSHMCRDFIRGNCTYGESCKFRHSDCSYSHSENASYARPINANLQQGGLENDRNGRSRSPCRNFLRGRCIYGINCRRLHIENAAYVDDENNEVTKDSRSRSPCRRSWLHGSFCPYMHPNMHDKPKFDYSTQHHQGHTDVKDALHSDDMDLASRKRSYEGPRTGLHGEFGNDNKKIKEFCLKFSKGRCDRGDSCRYLHSFHEYAKSNPVSSKEYHLQKDVACNHVGNGSVSHDDEKEEVVDGDISLWSQPFKRRKSWSESPFAYRDDSSCTRVRRDEFQIRNLVPFQYHHHSWSRYNSDKKQPHSKATTTSMDLSCQIDKDSDVEILNQSSECELAKGDLCCDSHLTKSQVMCNGNGMSLGECVGGSLDSNNSFLHEKGDISNGQIGQREVKVESTSPECDNSLRNNNGELESIRPNFKGKLLILDVNGILADIVADYPESFKPDTVVSMKGVFKRPFCDEFLDFCFERFDVGVWSSRNKKNVDKVIDFLMGDSKKKLLFCWDQSYCTDTGYMTVENRDKPLLLKELRRLWEKQVDDLPWEEGFYNETNTILLDDSPYKALRNPTYTAVFPSPFTFRDSKDTDLGPNGKLRLYLEALSKAENVQKFIEENPFGQRPITKSNLSWRFYSKIVDDH